ncbi:hypothetical protein [Planobispora takensis]|uniref:Uncharacterized protein n=1 Tax=Planobispora takensis TaxID=1367882 RepID=A0A8J3SXL8_9ACTN|nr:hypothetical protein [Planobispora takensis]GII02312.1 hypothetical protein Pta02_43200 [Planobispora takensis]
MTKAYAADQMPQEVRTARLLIRVQAATGLLGLVLLIGPVIFGVGSLPPLWYSLLPPSSLLVLVPLGLLTVLTTRYDSRKRWVRITVFTAEGFVILFSLLFLLGSHLGSFPGLALGIAVVFWLARPAARSWFSD